MQNGQPPSYEELLALYNKKEQELHSKDEELKQKNLLIQEQANKLDEADRTQKDIEEKLTTTQDALKANETKLSKAVTEKEAAVKAKNKAENAQRKTENVLIIRNKKIESMDRKLKTANDKIEKQKTKYNDLKQKYIELEESYNKLKERMGIEAYNFWKSTTEKTKVLDENNPYKADAGDENGDAPEKVNRKKGKSGRPNINKKHNLPIREFHSYLQGDKRYCSFCGAELIPVRSHTVDRIVHVPGFEYIERYVYYTYDCPKCTGNEEAGIKITSKEGSMIDGGIATPSLLAHVFTSKYLQHTPFYTQAQVYGWQKVNLCRQNFTKWQLAVYERLKPLENLFFDLLKKSKYLMMDETPFKVQRINETERQAELWKNQNDNDLEAADEEDEIKVSMKQCYIWVTLGEYCGHKIIKYNFRWTRCGTFVKEMLESFEGVTIFADGYAGYDCAVRHYNEEHPDKTVSRCSCNVHGRRPWINSKKIAETKFVTEIVDLYNEIFTIEETYRKQYDNKEITEEEFLELRRKPSEEIFKKIHSKLEAASKKAKYLKSGTTNKAITYFLKHYEDLKRYLNYSFLPPSTNEAEQSIRPVTLTRKVAEFCGSGPGADSSCFLMSLIEMAKIEELNPEDYLRCLFERFPKIDPTNREELEQLLPWNIHITPFEMRGEWVKDDTYELMKKQYNLN